MSWVAFILVLGSMAFLAGNARVAGWIVNLLACGVWSWVAAEEQLYALGAQQGVLFFVGIWGLVNALRASNRARDRGYRPMTNPEGRVLRGWTEDPSQRASYADSPEEGEDVSLLSDEFRDDPFMR